MCTNYIELTCKFVWKLSGRNGGIPNEMLNSEEETAKKYFQEECGI